MPLIGAHGAWQGRERLDGAAHRAVERAEAEGGARGLKRASPDLLLLALLREEQDTPRRVLATLDIDVEALLETLGPARADADEPVVRVALDADAREAVILGVNEARRARAVQAGTGHLLLGLIEARSGSGVRALIKAGAALGPLRDAVDAVEEAANAGDGGAAATLFAAAFRPFLARAGGAATCPHCGAPLHRTFRYCYNCGRERKPEA